MKKILMTLAAVLCCTVIMTVFTSCSKDDDSLSNYAAYTVNPSGSIKGNCLEICEKMRSALESGMTYTNGVCKRDDTKAISICDGIYKSTSATANFTIVLQVTPFGNGVNNTTSTIKTYEY